MFPASPSVLPTAAFSPVRIVLIEDHPMVREGMLALVRETTDLAVCGEAATPDEALVVVRRERPDVVCLDLRLGAADGFGLIHQLREIEPGLRILVLSMRDEHTFAERCIRAGALGYAMKSEANETLLAALRRVATGNVHVSARVAMTVLNDVPRHQNSRKGIAGLSERETQVFQLIGLGWSSRQIGEKLGIGIKTVETHREHIKNKLGLEHSIALAREAMRWVQHNS